MNQSVSMIFPSTPHRWGIKAIFSLKNWQIWIILSRQAGIFQMTVCLDKFQNRHLWQLVEINCNRWQVLLYNKIRNRHLWQLKSPFLTR